MKTKCSNPTTPSRHIKFKCRKALLFMKYTGLFSFLDKYCSRVRFETSIRVQYNIGFPLIFIDLFSFCDRVCLQRTSGHDINLLSLNRKVKYEWLSCYFKLLAAVICLTNIVTVTAPFSVMLSLVSPLQHLDTEHIAPWSDGTAPLIFSYVHFIFGILKAEWETRMVSGCCGDCISSLIKLLLVWVEVEL